MAISTIRKITDEDNTRIEAAFASFSERHNIEIPHSLVEKFDPDYSVWSERRNGLVYGDELNRLRPLLLACFRRAVRHPSANAVGYGYIGWEA